MKNSERSLIDRGQCVAWQWWGVPRISKPAIPQTAPHPTKNFRKIVNMLTIVSNNGKKA